MRKLQTILVLALGILFFGGTIPTHANQAKVHGEYCYQYGDSESLDVYLPLLASVVKPAPKYLRINSKEFSTWTDKFRTHEDQMYMGKIGETRKEKMYRNFEKKEIRGINYASGLTAGKDHSFWAVSDRHNKLFHLDRLKHRIFVRETVELKFAESTKEKIAAENPEFKFDRLDMEGIAYNHKKEVFYIVSEKTVPC